MGDPRKLAANAIELLTHEDVDHVMQGVELLRAQDHAFRQLLLAELLRGGYRRATAALLTSSLDAARAHEGGVRLARWAVLELLGEASDATDVRAAAIRAVGSLPDAEIDLGPVAVGLAKAPNDQGAAAAVRSLAKLVACEPREVPKWSRQLQRVLDSAFWSDLHAPRGPVMRELERLCADLLA